MFSHKYSCRLFLMVGQWRYHYDLIIIRMMTSLRLGFMFIKIGTSGSAKYCFCQPCLGCLYIIVEPYSFAGFHCIIINRYMEISSSK